MILIGLVLSSQNAYGCPECTLWLLDRFGCHSSPITERFGNRDWALIQDLSYDTLETTWGEMVLHITWETEYLKTSVDFYVSWHSWRVHSPSVYGQFLINSCLDYTLFNLVKKFLLPSIYISKPYVWQVIQSSFLETSEIQEHSCFYSY